MLLPIADQFVAGETPAEAISHAASVRDRGIRPMLNLLGSHHDDRETAVADAREYQRLIDDLADAGLTGAISVKPTQIGLDCGVDVFEELLWEIVETAADRDSFVWIDMEEHTTTDVIVDTYETIANEYAGVAGLCLQADLYRTPADLARLADVPGKIRLVKGGAYDTPASVAHTETAAIDQAYRSLLEQAFATVDGTVAIATHDPEMIEYATTLAETSDASEDFEIQMLMGVRPDAQRELAADYDCWQYVPYGTRWKRWAINRTRQNLGLATRSIAETVLPAGGGLTRSVSGFNWDGVSKFKLMRESGSESEAVSKPEPMRGTESESGAVSKPEPMRGTESESGAVSNPATSRAGPESEDGSKPEPTSESGLESASE